MPFTLLLAAAMFPLVLGGAPADPPPQRWGPDIRRMAPYDEGYERGYLDGVRDARTGHEPALEPLGPPRGPARGPRRGFRGEVQRGYGDGYRAGFTSEREARMAPGAGSRGNGVTRSTVPDPAFARGQADGYRRGFDDGNDRDRYDPTREGAYRDGDAGYFREYGSKDAYRRNYRDGFRQGYEGGFRDGARTSAH